MSSILNIVNNCNIPNDKRVIISNYLTSLLNLDSSTDFKSVLSSAANEVNNFYKQKYYFGTKEINGIKVNLYGTDETILNTLFEKLEKTIDICPEELIRNVQEFSIMDYNNPLDVYWKYKYNKGEIKFTSAAVGGVDISFFKTSANSTEAEFLKTLLHETGHTLDRFFSRISKSHFTDTFEIWKWAMDLDKIYSGYEAITPYAKKSIHEDFAETVAYSQTNQDIVNDNLPNRYMIVTELINALSNSTETQLKLEYEKRKLLDFSKLRDAYLNGNAKSSAQDFYTAIGAYLYQNDSSYLQKLDRGDTVMKLLQNIDNMEIDRFIKNNMYNDDDVRSSILYLGKVKNFKDLMSKITPSRDIYPQYIRANGEQFDRQIILNTRESIYNKYSNNENVELLYWGNDNVNIPTNENQSFLNIKIGFEPNYPLRNSFKVYVPFNSSSFSQTVNQVFDFLVKENIASDNKIGNNSRTDCIVLRIYSKADLIKVADFINSSNIIIPNNNTLPFCMKYGKLSIAMDGLTSYNSVVTKVLKSYLSSTNNPTYDGFKSHIANIIYNINNGNFTEYERLFKEETGLTDIQNNLQVLETIEMALDEEMQIQDFLDRCEKNQDWNYYFEKSEDIVKTLKEAHKYGY